MRRKIYSAQATMDKYSELTSALQSAIHDWALSEGFEEADVNEYFFVDVDEDPDREGVLNAEVRAELDYDGMLKLSNTLDPIVAAFDKDAYFEMEEPGIMLAVIELRKDKTEKTEEAILEGYVGTPVRLIDMSRQYNGARLKDMYDRYTEETGVIDSVFSENGEVYYGRDFNSTYWNVTFDSTGEVVGPVPGYSLDII